VKREKEETVMMAVANGQQKEEEQVSERQPSM
jgi:hypothetical protein